MQRITRNHGVSNSKRLFMRTNIRSNSDGHVGSIGIVLTRIHGLCISWFEDLSRHRKLKRLDLCVSSLNRTDFHETIQRLVEQAEQLKLTDLRITNFGIEKEAIRQRYFRINLLSHQIGLFVLDNFNLITNDFMVDYLPWRIELPFPFDFYPPLAAREMCRSRLNIEKVSVYDRWEDRRTDPNFLVSNWDGGVRDFFY